MSTWAHSRHTTAGELVIDTGQEEKGFPYRTSVVNMRTGEHVMYTIDSHPAYSLEDARVMHARYVERFTPVPTTPEPAPVVKGDAHQLAFF